MEDLMDDLMFTDEDENVAAAARFADKIRHALTEGKRVKILERQDVFLQIDIGGSAHGHGGSAGYCVEVMSSLFAMAGDTGYGDLLSIVEDGSEVLLSRSKALAAHAAEMEE